MVRIKILSSALRDLREGSDFYERQNPALGDYFLDSLFSDIDSLLLYAGIHRKVYGYHRALSKRFPYAIYYAMDGRGSLRLDPHHDPILPGGLQTSVHHPLRLQGDLRPMGIG